MKNFYEIFQKYKIKLLDKINIESNKYISLLKTLGFRNSFKTIDLDRYSAINHLLTLKDGRLISYSGTGHIHVYKKDTFELQLSIRLHSLSCEYAIQINNENIWTCSYDCTMKFLN